MTSVKSNLFKAFFVAIVFVANLSVAQQQNTYDFLNLNVDARSSAMAGSFVSVDNDVNAIFYNPAGLATLKGKQASVGFFKYLMDINSGNVSYSQKYKELGYFGAGIRYVNYGTFDKYDESYQNLGSFGASDLALSLGYANVYKENFKYGANAKFIYSNIDEYSSVGLALDLGALYTIPEHRMNFGLSVLNLGTQVKKYISTNESLPLDIRIGMTKSLEHLPLTVNLGFARLADTYDNFFERFKNIVVGGEFVLNDYVLFRLGYNNAERKNYKTGSSIGISGFSAGIGIVFTDKYKLDYAFNSLGNIGAAHRFNLGFNL
ncbi:MAG: type IX secretion system protein PorQ [Ignavibacteria bacterium]